MKKFNLILLASLLLLLAACANNDEKDKDNGESINASLEEISAEIKQEIAKDLEADGVGDALVDGQLAMYAESDLTASPEEDEAVQFWLETLGIEQADLAAGTAFEPMMNVKSDQFIILEAKEASKLESLKEALDAQLENQIAEWEVYLPDQYEKVKNNKIVTKGNFSLYVTYDDPDKIVKIFEDSFK